MLPYIILLIISFLSSFIALGKRNGSIVQINTGNTLYVKLHNWALPIFFTFLFFLLAFRSESVGNDTLGYHHIFDAYRSMSFRSFLVFEPEVLFAMLNWVIGQFTDNYQIYLAIVAALTLIPIAYLYTEDKEYSFLKIILFMNMSTFIMLFSGIRQMLAVSVGIVAYWFVRKKKWYVFIPLVFVAIGFHHSAIILFLLYPLYHLKFRPIHFLFILPLIFAVFFFNAEIFAYLTEYYMNYTDAVSDIAIQSTNAYTMILVFAGFTILSFIVPDESRMDQEAIALRNILVLTVILQCFAPVHALSMRMNYYFIIFVPICIAKIIKAAQIKYRSIAEFAGVIICILFTLYYIWNLWMANGTGGSLHTVPYIPFWSNEL